MLRLAAEIEETPGVKLTPLGRAALQHADRAPLAEVADEPLIVTIDPDDRLAYTRIFDLMSTHGEGLLIDKYLTLEGLADIMEISSVNRVLTSDDARRNRLGLFARALGTDDDSPRLRTLAAVKLHDRYFIPRRWAGVRLGVQSQLDLSPTRRGHSDRRCSGRGHPVHARGSVERRQRPRSDRAGNLSTAPLPEC